VDAAAWGIEPGYHDYQGAWRETSPETTDALLAAMGASPDRPTPPDVADLRFVRPGDVVEGRWRLLLEDGAEVDLAEGEGRLPPDVPLGYHTLVGDDAECRLIVSPGACLLPEDKTWGWAVQLYAARSAQSWGIGDLADLRTLAEWSAANGAGMALVNPLHASLPTAQSASPYFPGSRCFRNPVYLRVDGPAPDEVKALNAERVIDRDAVWRLKQQALEAEFERFGGSRGFDRYVAELGDVLARYAAFCALAEKHGLPWTDWPAEAEAKTADPDRVRFHQWLQWRIDEQLRHAAEPVGLVQDLAIGCDPAGADAWLWQDAFALGVRVGAPPDEFNTQGQDWGVPPFNPWRLRAAHYEPFIQIIRAGLRHAGGIRIDHVMGLFRLFWIPPEADARAGAYVRYPFRELLDIVALESHRASAYVVGEDLGTVTDEMRAELRDRNVLSYRLLWFEPEPPPRFPERALAAVTTHDLPTIPGMWSGSDLREQDELGLEPNVDSTRAIHERLQDWLGLPADAPAADVVLRAYSLLGQAPSAIVTATLDDALLVEERPNIPGTTDERPNWSLALPKPIEDITQDPLVDQVAAALGENRGSPQP
jgi:4-alpha-glucanotransferase